MTIFACRISQQTCFDVKEGTGDFQLLSILTTQVQTLCPTDYLRIRFIGAKSFLLRESVGQKFCSLDPTQTSVLKPPCGPEVHSQHLAFTVQSDSHPGPLAAMSNGYAQSREQTFCPTDSLRGWSLGQHVCTADVASSTQSPSPPIRFSP